MNYRALNYEPQVYSLMKGLAKIHEHVASRKNHYKSNDRNIEIPAKCTSTGIPTSATNNDYNLNARNVETQAQQVPGLMVTLNPKP